MTKLGLLLVLLVAACGDNSEQCGPGTVSRDGTCVWDGSGNTICGDGTTLDPVSNTCVLDPNLCQGGTVLVNGTCQDPNGNITVDLQEGPEPNGFESTALPAGYIVPKAIGAGGFVVHGCIEPVGGSADLDLFSITVVGPTLLDITAAGVDGLDGAFLVHDPDPEHPGWLRFGLNVANNTSHRQVFLPETGNYDFAVADTRSLLGFAQSGSMDMPAAGNTDGTSCYYVTITQEAIPAPVAITTATGLVPTPLAGDKVLFVSAPLPAGLIDVSADDDAGENYPTFDVLVNDAWLLSDTNLTAHLGGIASTDTTVFALDYIYNYNNGIVPNYSLTFDLASDAQALPTTGTTVNSLSAGQDNSANHLDLYYFDAPAPFSTLGMNLTFSHPVQGAIIDARTRGTIANFGGLTFSSPATRFTHYDGLVRVPDVGRYYLAIYDTADPVGTAFTVTSTITPVTTTPLVVGTPLTAQPNNTFNENVFSLDLTANPWDQLTTAGTNTGNLAISFYANTATGRLDPLSYSAGGTAGPELVPLATGTFTSGGTGGLVLGANRIFATVVPQTPTGTPTFDLDLEARTFTSIAATAPYHHVFTAEATTTGSSLRYLVTTAPGKTITVTAHPATVASNPIVSRFDNQENTVTSTSVAAGADATLTITQDASGYTPISIRGPAGAAETYDLTIDVQ